MTFENSDKLIMPIVMHNCSNTVLSKFKRNAALMHGTAFDAIPNFYPRVVFLKWSLGPAIGLPEKFTCPYSI